MIAWILRTAAVGVLPPVKSWDRVFQKVFTTAKPAITGGHPHRFRDTFAVSLLLKGVSIEIVSTLLGHSSIKVTERHYSPWVKARQDRWRQKSAESGALQTPPRCDVARRASSRSSSLK